MKRLVFVLFWLFSVFLLHGEIMTVHTNTGDYVFNVSEIIEIYFDPDGSTDDFIEFMNNVPIKFLRNFPNPFNPATSIQFEITQKGRVKVEIFNIKGQKVNTLLDNELEAGIHELVWKGNDVNDHKVTSGIYFYRVIVNEQEKIKKMIMIK